MSALPSTASAKSTVTSSISKTTTPTPERRVSSTSSPESSTVKLEESLVTFSTSSILERTTLIPVSGEISTTATLISSVSHQTESVSPHEMSMTSLGTFRTSTSPTNIISTSTSETRRGPVTPTPSPSPEGNLFTSEANIASTLLSTTPVETVSPTSKPPVTTECFTLNFTTKNVKYEPPMSDPKSKLFSATERVFRKLFGEILKTSKIGPHLINCNLSTLRPVNQGKSIGVDSVCCYRKTANAPPFDRVNIYRKFINETNGFTKMRNYKLDPNSLFVNDYHEAPPQTTLSPTSKPPVTTECFTVNFTTTNLIYRSEMADPTSKIFSKTQQLFINMLGQILNTSKIGPDLINCSLSTLRPVNEGKNTGVNSVCCYRKNTTAPPFDRVNMYHKFINETNGFTKMKNYNLDPNSLFVNDYHEAAPQTTLSPTSKPPVATECFTVNLTVTNLIYRPEMADPTSRIFRSTQRLFINSLERILNTSKIGPDLINCSLSTLRPVNEGKNTRVNSVCCYRKTTSAPPFDRVNIYHKFRNETNGFTTMERYNLDPNSLFVNDYHEAAPQTTLSPTSKPPVATECFTVNLTVTNLIYRPEMADPTSRIFRSTQRLFVNLLGRRLNTSKIGPDLINCSLSTLRPVNEGKNTRVNSVCCYRKTTSAPPFDRVNIYHKFRNETNGFTKMERYNLDPNSLFVNDYHEAAPQTTVSPTSKPPVATECFTVNFTTNNLIYRQQMSIPKSKLYISTQRVFSKLLEQILKASKIGPDLINCNLSTLRPVNEGKNTGVDSVCCYRKTATAAPFDRVNIYHKFINETNGFTNMDRYNLDPDSLFVNDYHETSPQTTVSPTSKPPVATECFTVNFTTKNLIYRQQMSIPKSKLFTSTQRVFSKLMEQILKASKIGPDLINCNLSTLRPVNEGKNTGVDSVCCYRKTATAAPFDRVNIYRKFINETNGFTKMERYNLDPDSLFVKDYHEASPQTTVSPTSKPPVATECFTLNFTTNNLIYRQQMSNPKSKLYISTQRVFSKLLGQILKASKIGPDLINCSLSTLRPVNEGKNTGVNSVCCYRKTTSAPPFDRVNIYHKFRNETNSFTKMERYNLDPNSLFVNDYHEAPPQTTLSPTSKLPAATECFTVNFTATNLIYRSEMANPTSRIFSTTQRFFDKLLGDILKKSDIGPDLINCRLSTLRSVNQRKYTGVDSVCCYRKAATAPTFDPINIYQKFINETNHFTKMGRYNLDPNSLFVNGYSPSTTDSAPDLVGYELGFKIINNNLTNTNPLSPEYKQLMGSISNELNQLFHQSSISDGFKICAVTKLRIGSIIVDCKCYFHPARNISKETVKNVFQQETQNATSQWLGSRFQFMSFTIEVTNQPPHMLKVKNFTVNFTIINLPYKDMKDPKSEVYQKTKASIKDELNHLYQRSDLNKSFVGCSVKNLRPTSHESQTDISSLCTFAVDFGSRTFDKDLVYDIFKNLTQNASLMGKYSLDNNSININAYPSAMATTEPPKQELPYWAIILICFSVLLGSIFFFLLCVLTVVWVKRRAGKYQIQRNIFGLYFPCMGMQKS
ncbi:mucin-16 isoform X2 [Pantherophis guttatus]|uniref:Mucin-16 isoform X2 n=1 Tax=Pantherophis guttatus TaxID=94885 RepID=A0ABM3ZQF1_PANGU|nr:mucin-16 isoform X2 [Pantherophis guttatus]